MAEVLTLTDYAGNAYTFPGSFWISDDPFSANVSIQKTFYAAGGRRISDGTLNNRILSVKGTLYAEGGQTYEQRRTALMLAINKGGQLSRNFGTSSRYLDVVFLDCATGPEEGTVLKELTITFACEFPLWKASALTTDTQIVTGDATLSVDNTGSEYVVKPVITITADQAADIPSVKMVQNSDGAMTFEYNDPLFVIGDVVVIDSEYGTVKRNGIETPENFNPARFFRLQPGVNSIDYEGAAATITIEFRKVYL